MDLHPGMYVTPNVCLERQLGEGGMGSVWVANHLSLNTRVAVKFVSADLVKTDPTIIERFKREAALCAQIKSPHVVQTFDHGVMQDGRPYIVMELLEGESLQQRLERTGPLSFDDAKAVVTQTCKALSRAHKLGIVHRDIKPDNLFLTPDEDEPFLLKVLDFGIAKQTGLPQAMKMTSTGSMVGTPEYMSPEQVLSGNSIDFRSDLWAVGVVAYHCLTGTVPFQAETLGSLCVAIANGRFRPPSQLRGDLLPSVDRWIARSLALDPMRRHGSAKELAQSFAFSLTPNATLEEMSVGEGVVAFTDEGGAGNSGPWGLTPAPPSAASPAGPAFAPGNSAVPAYSGPAVPAVHVAASRTPSPTAMSATVFGGAPKPSKGGTVLALGAGAIALAGGIAYFFLSAPPRATDAAQPTASAEVPTTTGAPTASALVADAPTASASTTTAGNAAPSATATAAATATTAPSPQVGSGAPTTTSTIRFNRPTAGASATTGGAVDRGF